MKIASQYPQFAEERALFVVTGRNVAKFYIAADGELWEAHVLTIPTPKYSDREGHFESRAPGVGTLRAGAVYENKKEVIIQKLARELNSRINNILRKEKGIRLIFIFAPAYTRNRIIQKLSADAQTKYIEIIEGNHYQKHPFELLERIMK